VAATAVVVDLKREEATPEVVCESAPAGTKKPADYVFCKK
jgi:hypothetical protein